MKVYIACALTHVPRERFAEYAIFLHSLAAFLTKSAHNVTYALVHSDPILATKPISERARFCYLWDKELVEDAEVLVAEASFPSIGLGIELQVAAANGTPIVLCFCDREQNKATPVSYENPDHTRHDLQIGEGFVSLMALGLPSVFRVIRYSDVIDATSRIAESLALLEKSSW